MTKVLVLNNSFEPLNVCDWKRAVSMVVTGKVEVLEYADHGPSGSASESRIPVVVRLKRFVKRPQLRLAPSRRNIFHRDGWACRYCGAHGHGVKLTLDHVTPRCQGGKNSWENLVTACSRCNGRKGGQNLEESGMKLSKVPSRPRHVAAFRASMYKKLGQSHPSWEKYLP